MKRPISGTRGNFVAVEDQRVRQLVEPILKFGTHSAVMLLSAARFCKKNWSALGVRSTATRLGFLSVGSKPQNLTDRNQHTTARIVRSRPVRTTEPKPAWTDETVIPGNGVPLYAPVHMESRKGAQPRRGPEYQYRGGTKRGKGLSYGERG